MPGGTPTRILSESGCLLSGAGREDLRRRAGRQGDSRHGVASAARQVGTGALGTAATATGHAELILEIIERRGAGIDACANLALSDSVTNTNVHETNYLESPCHMQASSCLPGPGVFPARLRSSGLAPVGSRAMRQATPEYRRCRQPERSNNKGSHRQRNGSREGRQQQGTSTGPHIRHQPP